MTTIQGTNSFSPQILHQHYLDGIPGELSSLSFCSSYSSYSIYSSYSLFQQSKKILELHSTQNML